MKHSTFQGLKGGLNNVYGLKSLFKDVKVRWISKYVDHTGFKYIVLLSISKLLTDLLSCSSHLSQNLLSCLRPSLPANMTRQMLIWAQTVAASCVWSHWMERATVQ